MSNLLHPVSSTLITQTELVEFVKTSTPDMDGSPGRDVTYPPPSLNSLSPLSGAFTEQRKECH